MSSIKEIQNQLITELIDRRFEIGLLQNEVAELANVNVNTISRIENVKYSPKLETLIQITEVLGLELILKRKL